MHDAQAQEPEVPARAAVLVRDLEHAYGERTALAGVGFGVRRGEIFGFLGPNGGGKTTLFRLLATLLPIQKGTAHVLGLDAARERAAVRRRLGVVFQSPALDARLSVHENLRCQGHLYGLRGADLARRIDAGLERFGIADRRRSRVETLSGGLCRRVELAKGMLHSPAVLLLDEPSTGLDPGARRDLWRALQAVRAEGVTVLLTSHILEEAERCDRVAILDRGRIVALGAPRDLEAELGGDVVTIVARDPARLVPALAERLGVRPVLVDGVLRLERGAGADLVRRLLETFPQDIDSVKLARPTLEDVFIHCTGRAFEGGEAAVALAAAAAAGTGREARA